MAAQTSAKLFVASKILIERKNVAFGTAKCIEIRIKTLKFVQNKFSWLAELLKELLITLKPLIQ